MKIKSAALELSAPTLHAAPRRRLPEFALIGRSNVGKSSLVNLLTHRKELARTSNTPGKTQLMNYYLVNDAWRLVDLPGYGYAKVGKQQRLEFNAAVVEYLSDREMLRRVFVLIDSRLPPQPIDLEFLQWLTELGAPFALIFTKTDKHSSTQVHASVARFQQVLGEVTTGLPPCYLSSAENGAGRAEILAAIAADLARTA